MDIKLSKNSWHVKLYKFWWLVDKIPTNLCNYFWSLMLILITLPLFPGYLVYRKMVDDPEEYSLSAKIVIYLLSTVIIGLIAVVAVLIIIAFIENIFIGSILLFSILLGTLVYLYAKKKEYTDEILDTMDMTGQYIKAKKDKVCPRITWVDQTEESNTL